MPTVKPLLPADSPSNQTEFVDILMILCNTILHLGDYEKLWGAVTGGRGTGERKEKD